MSCHDLRPAPSAGRISLSSHQRDRVADARVDVSGGQLGEIAPNDLIEGENLIDEFHDIFVLRCAPKGAVKEYRLR